jgi:molybdopterin converting factor small subunit
MTGGTLELQLDAPDVRNLLGQLEERFPGVREKLADMAVAIDGEIFNDPLLEPIEDSDEVHFVPRLQGG